MNDAYLDLFYGSSKEELEDSYKQAIKYHDDEQPAGKKIIEDLKEMAKSLI